LTLCNALQAREHGADIFPHTEFLSAFATDGLWQLTIRDRQNNVKIARARSLINAGGPWVADIHQQMNLSESYPLALIKGSHIVVHKFYEGEHAYLLQHDDGRIVFVIPWQGNTMIGTTDVVFSEPLDDITVSSQEIAYLFQLVGHYFTHTLSEADIIHTWSGVRTLPMGDQKTPQTLSREYKFHFSSTPAPVISIYGGKITTYRRLAAEVVDELRAAFPALTDSITDKIPLPGACFKSMRYRQYSEYARNTYSWLEHDLLTRLLSTYGSLTDTILKDSLGTESLGQHFGQGLYQREVDYLCQHEWAESSDDILWRRTKLGLYFTAEDRARLNDYLRTRAG
jgi:glycerol-3-phosphate dehydrogenase